MSTQPTPLTFEWFERVVRGAGLSATDRGDGHWQVRGAVTVNYYPFAKRGPTIYVNGARRGCGTGDTSRVIEIALEGPPVIGTGRRRKGRFVKAERARLYRIDRRCRWCRMYLREDEATLDHIIPLSRGGSDRRDNLALSCVGCNSARGHNVNVAESLPLRVLRGGRP